MAIKKQDIIKKLTVLRRYGDEKKALILFMTGMLATTSLTGCGSWNGDDVALTVGKEEISSRCRKLLCKIYAGNI